MILPDEILVDGFCGGRRCAICTIPIAGRRDKKFCGAKCAMVDYRAKHGLGAKYNRDCRACGTSFECSGQGSNNRWHCSDECARQSASKWRIEFKKRRPERAALYQEARKHREKGTRDTRLNRFWRKYPDMPQACEACGESRVLDVAHKPEHRRLGAWQSMKNTTPEQVWILCPTCHALLDRRGFTPDQLGIKPRKAEAA